MYITNIFKIELIKLLKINCIMHMKILICCLNHSKRTKYETCAKLHRCYSLNISGGRTPLIMLPAKVFILCEKQEVTKERDNKSVISVAFDM